MCGGTKSMTKKITEAKVSGKAIKDRESLIKRLGFIDWGLWVLFPIFRVVVSEPLDLCTIEPFIYFVMDASIALDSSTLLYQCLNTGL